MYRTKALKLVKKLVFATIMVLLTLSLFFACSKEKDTSDKVIVSFVPDGGDEILPIEIEKGFSFSELPSPKKANYQFVSWYLDKELTLPLLDGYLFNSDTVLFPKWQGIPVKIIVTDIETSIEYELTYEYGTILNKLDFTKTGYKIISFKMNGEELIFPFTVTSPIAVIADTEKEIYTLSFNNASTNIPDIKAEYGETVTLPNAGKLKQKVFGGWLKQYSESIYSDTYVVTESALFSAIWENSKIAALKIYDDTLKKTFYLNETVDWEKVVFQYVYDDGLNSTDNYTAKEGGVNVSAFNTSSLGKKSITFYLNNHKEVQSIFEYEVFGYAEFFKVTSFSPFLENLTFTKDEEIEELLKSEAVRFIITFDSPDDNSDLVTANCKEVFLLSYTDSYANYEYIDKFYNRLYTTVYFTIEE